MSDHADETLYGVDLLRALCDESGRDDAPAALDALLAEMDEVLKDRARLADVVRSCSKERAKLRAERQQAIEALREIAYRNADEAQWIAREALSKLGEDPS